MNKDELLEKLRQSDLPTVIDFWAPWCAPCRRTKPILDQLGQEFADQVNYQAINADEHPELMRGLKIFSIPNLMIVNHQKEIRHIVGAQSPGYYREMFETLANGETMTISISNTDRFLRLGSGAALAIIAWTYALWWLLPIGLLVIFWGIHDRCPIWQAISARFRPKI